MENMQLGQLIKMLICEFKTFKALWKKQATGLSTECKLGRRNSNDRKIHRHTHWTHTPTSYVLKIHRECRATDETYNLRLNKVCTHRESKSVIFRKWKLKLSPPAPSPQQRKAHNLKLHTCSSFSVIANKIMPLK